MVCEGPEAVAAAGFRPVGGGQYLSAAWNQGARAASAKRVAHHLWELRPEDEGWRLVRLHEERLPDFRTASRRTAGRGRRIVKTAYQRARASIGPGDYDAGRLADLIVDEVIAQLPDDPVIEGDDAIVDDLYRALSGSAGLEEAASIIDEHLGALYSPLVGDLSDEAGPHARDLTAGYKQDMLHDNLMEQIKDYVDFDWLAEDPDQLAEYIAKGEQGLVSEIMDEIAADNSIQRNMGRAGIDQFDIEEIVEKGVAKFFKKNKPKKRKKRDAQFEGEPMSSRPWDSEDVAAA
jgi:hypothetical protein